MNSATAKSLSVVTIALLLVATGCRHAKNAMDDPRMHEKGRGAQIPQLCTAYAQDGHSPFVRLMVRDTRFTRLNGDVAPHPGVNARDAAALVANALAAACGGQLNVRAVTTEKSATHILGLTVEDIGVKTRERSGTRGPPTFGVTWSAEHDGVAEQEFSGQVSEDMTLTEPIRKSASAALVVILSTPPRDVSFSSSRASSSSCLGGAQEIRLSVDTAAVGDVSHELRARLARDLTAALKRRCGEDVVMVERGEAPLIVELVFTPKTPPALRSQVKQQRFGVSIRVLAGGSLRGEKARGDIKGPSLVDASLDDTVVDIVEIMARR